jgi:hypothetical protein
MQAKTEIDLKSFPFVEKPILSEHVLKKDHLITFVELSKFRFLMHAFQDQPLCSSTSQISIKFYQHGSVGSALACCKAGKSTNLGSALH